MSTGIVILAAGESARMGEPKQLLPYRGTTLLQHSINTALSVHGTTVVVVLGAHAAQIRAELNDPRVLVTVNPDWADGMGSSLRTGLRALLGAQPDVSAAIFLLCDQPLVSTATLHNLICTHERTGFAIVASEYDGILGVPALFAREMFQQLLALRGSEGARQVIRAHRDEAIGVTFQDGAVDIDTPADYAQLRDELPTPTPV